MRKQTESVCFLQTIFKARINRLVLQWRLTGTCLRLAAEEAVLSRVLSSVVSRLSVFVRGCVPGVGFEVCGVWFMVYGLWFMGYGSGFGFQVSGFRFRVSGTDPLARTRCRPSVNRNGSPSHGSPSGIKVQGRRVEGSGFRVVEDSGFRVGVGFRVSAPIRG